MEIVTIIWWLFVGMAVVLALLPVGDTIFNLSDSPTGVGSALLMAYGWGGALVLAIILALWSVIDAALG